MNQTILSSTENSIFQKQFPTQQSPLSPEQPKRSSFSKTRVSIVYNGKEEFVSWYGSTPSQTIEEAIKTVFQLPSNSRLFLKDLDGDVVAIAPTLPAGETFCLFVSSNNNSVSSSSPKLNNSASFPKSFDSGQSNAEIAESPSSPLNDQQVDLSSSNGNLNTSSGSAMVDKLPIKSSSTSSSPEPLKSALLSENDDANEDLSGSQKRLSSGDLGIEEEDDEDDPRKKRKRRKAVEIDRSFKCSMANCQKIYGSENALKMHIKLKHPEYQYLIMQQQIPLSNKTSPPIIVNNKLLNYNNSNNSNNNNGNTNNNYTQQYQQYQAQVQQQYQQQQQQMNNRVPTSLLFQQQQQHHQQQIQQQQYQQYQQQQQQQQQQHQQQQQIHQHRTSGGIPSMKYYSEQQQHQQQQQQYSQQHHQYNGGNGLPKLFNNHNNSQVPTTELRNHLQSFLAKEKSNISNNNNNNNNNNNDHYSTINKIISATNMTNFFPSNLHPSFFQSFQQQLNQLIAGNPGIAQDILKYDIEELSNFIKKQIDQVKLKQEGFQQQQQTSQRLNQLNNNSNNSNINNNNNNNSNNNNRLPNFNYFSNVKPESDEEDLENEHNNRLKNFSFSKRQFERNEEQEEQQKQQNDDDNKNSNNETFKKQQQKTVDSELSTPNSSPINNSNNSSNINNLKTTPTISSSSSTANKTALRSTYSPMQSSPLSTSSTTSKGNLSFLVSSNNDEDDDHHHNHHNQVEEPSQEKNNTCIKNEPNHKNHNQPDTNAASLLLVWSPEKVPTKDDVLILSNGGSLLINYNENCSSGYLSINEGEFFLFGQYNIYDSMDLKKGRVNIITGGVLNVQKSIQVNGSFEITNDITLTSSENTIISTDSFIIGNSGILNINQQSKLLLSSKTLELNNNSLVNVEKSAILFSSNLVMNSASSIKAKYCEVLFESINCNNKSKVDISNSKFKIKGPLIMNENSKMNSEKGELEIESIECYSDSIILFKNTNLEINGDSTLKDQSQFNIQNGSITVSGGIDLNDSSKLSLFDNIEMTITGDLIMNGNSEVLLKNKAEMSFYGGVKMNNNSKIFINGPDSVVNIANEFYLSENCQFVVTQCNFNAWDNSSFHGNTIFNSSDFNLHKTTTWYGGVYGIDSVFKAHGSLIVNSKSTRIRNSILYSYDDFLINGQLETDQTTIYIEGGNSILSNSSNIYLNDSIFIINKGNLIVHPNAFINIENSRFILDNGIVETLGNIYLNKNSSFENKNGTYNLSSCIYYSNDINIKNNNITLKNDGIFNVVNDNVIINIAFRNSGNNSLGQLNINNNTIYINEFKNENGGELNLNGGTLSSDAAIQLNGGSIKGNGIFNTSIIQTNGEFGSSNTINNFNISGNFIQSNNSLAKIIIKIDSLDSFSTINIEKLADINGIVIIKINEILLNINNYNSEDSVNNNSDDSHQVSTTPIGPINASSEYSSSSSKPNSPATLKLVNFDSKTGNSFGNVKFQTFDSKGNEKDLDGASCVDTKISSTSFSVLIDTNDCYPDDNIVKALSIGAIVGIVVGCAIIVLVIMSIIHYRERARFLRILAKLKLSKISKKLSRK
ncbi:hypothetical protein ACTFIU_010859 [Dictyostelium citrinum]